MNFNDYQRKPRRAAEYLRESKTVELEYILSAAEVKIAAVEDAPIIAAAKKAGVNTLVSLDKKHILNRPERKPLPTLPSGHLFACQIRRDESLDEIRLSC